MMLENLSDNDLKKYEFLLKKTQDRKSYRNKLIEEYG